MESNFKTLCNQFGEILNAKGKDENGKCSVSLHRTFSVEILGKDASSILDVSVGFQSLDVQGNSLNTLEIALLQEEVPSFIQAAIQQGIIVSAVHNHWLYTQPSQIMYVHLISVEPPLQFARKIAYSFSQLTSLPVAK